MAEAQVGEWTGVHANESRDDVSELFVKEQSGLYRVRCTLPLKPAVIPAGTDCPAAAIGEYY